MISILVFVGLAFNAVSAGIPSGADKAMKLAAATYCTPSKIRAWNCIFCQRVGSFNMYATVDHDNLLGYTGIKDGEVVLAFRGTTNADNMLHDLDTRVTTVTGGKVHRGMWTAYQDIMGSSLKTQFLNAVRDNPRAKILVTGHSLGGAIASMAALDMKKEITSIFRGKGLASKTIKVFTFGAPRWCNKDMVNVYNRVLASTTNRITNSKDIVTRSPFGWKHVNKQTDCTDNARRCKSCSKECKPVIWFPRVKFHMEYLGTNMGCGALEGLAEPLAEPQSPLPMPQSPAMIDTPEAAQYSFTSVAALTSLASLNILFCALYARASKSNRMLQQALAK